MATRLITIPELSEKDSVRFWSKINTDGPIVEHCKELGPCWLWIGPKNSRGRGTFAADGKTYLASRIAFTVYRGPIAPDKPYVLHRCDNPSCIRDEHLFDGTQTDNMADMIKKGRKNTELPTTRGANHWSQRLIERRTWGKRNGAHTHPEKVVRGEKHFLRLHPEKILRGEKCKSSKLTEAQVLQIRKDWDMGEKNMTSLAREYGISIANVFRIVKRRMWTHI